MNPAFNPEIWIGWAPVGDTLQRMTNDGILVTVEPRPDLPTFTASWESVRKGTGYVLNVKNEGVLFWELERHPDLCQGWVA